MALIIADCSEFQGVIHPQSTDPIIIRGHNGFRADYDFAANRAACHAAGCAAVGIYQYLNAGEDAAGAARALLQTIGSLQPNEWLICDLEEGSGDEQPRWAAWSATVHQATGRNAWLYSGLSFAQTHDLHPDWVAAYQSNAPAGTYKLWQYTDQQPFPWGRADASVYPGPLSQFLVAAGITQPILPVPPNAPAPHKVTGNGCNGDKLAAGMSLGPNGYIESANGWVLMMQSDGNLVKYRPNNGGPAWSILNEGAQPVAGSVFIQQADGNMVVYAPGGHVVWNSGTQGHDGFWDVVQTDGNWVIYGGSPERPIWDRAQV